MNGTNTVITHYAILIGIDDYPDKRLKSPVRDVECIKTLLESKLKDSIKIEKITTSQTDQTSSKSVKDQMLWPTYNNVVSAFEMVTSLARAGDFVYIHYSGHGTQKPPCGEFSNKSTGDLALVLLSGGKENQERYLWGSELATLLKAMVDNGLVVTLVLDCCFSASVYRGEDPSVRFLPYDSKIDSRYPLDLKDNLWNENSDSVYRDASMLPNWLIRPDRYAILAACGPHEEAFGLKSDGQSHGALSYFLLKIIECIGLTRRHEDIYNHLRARFQGSGLPQNPVLFGNRNQGFFGQVNSDITAALVPIIVKQNGTVELKAGHAHGIIAGDQFLLYHLGYAEGDPRSQRHSVVAKVAGTRALTSDLEQLDIPSIRIRTGWVARALTRYSLQRFPIQLASSLPHRDEWLSALRERSLDVHVDTDKHRFTFGVVLNNDGEYEVLDESYHKVINLPRMPQDQTGVGQIGSILEHLARFRLARDLGSEAPADSFQESFKVFICRNGKSFGPNCLIEMEHSAIAELTVENRGETVLYIFVYVLGPCWEVENAYQATYAAVTLQNDEKRHKRTISTVLRVKVPDQMKDKGRRSCEDIVKVFVTSQPTSFDLVELPKLGELARTSMADRTSREGSDASENWAAMNFPIRITIQADTDK